MSEKVPSPVTEEFREASWEPDSELSSDFLKTLVSDLVVLDFEKKGLAQFIFLRVFAIAGPIFGGRGSGSILGSVKVEFLVLTGCIG